MKLTYTELNVRIRIVEWSCSISNVCVRVCTNRGSTHHLMIRSTSWIQFIINSLVLIGLCFTHLSKNVLETNARIQRTHLTLMHDDRTHFNVCYFALQLLVLPLAKTILLSVCFFFLVFSLSVNLTRTTFDKNHKIQMCTNGWRYRKKIKSISIVHSNILHTIQLIRFELNGGCTLHIELSHSKMSFTQ